jgi:poly(A) polymerase
MEVLDTAKPVIYPRDQHVISRSLLDQDALRIMYRLLRHGYKAYLVGGGVRDLLLNKRPKDFDIATDATPRRVKEIFRNSRIIGRRFKLVHVFFPGGKIIEVSTFRDFSEPIAEAPEESEGESDSLEVKKFSTISDNKFGDEVSDALRRDLTINGLYYDLASFSVIDYVGGVKDLNARVVRLIGQPDVRIQEDPVRMIRAVRHAARNEFRLDEATHDSIQRNFQLLRQASAVRVYEELKKDILSGYSLKILRMLQQMRLLELLLPQLTATYRAEDTGLAPAARPTLLEEGDLVTMLSRMDQMISQGSKLAPTIPLAILTLYAASALRGKPEQERLEILTQRTLAEELTQEFFASLAVPRRERERVDELLQLWARTLSVPISQVRSSALQRREAFPDLLSLIRILDIRAEQVDLLRHLQSRSEARRPRTDSDQSDSAGLSELSEEPSSGEQGDEQLRRRRRRRRGRRGAGGSHLPLSSA